MPDEQTESPRHGHIRENLAAVRERIDGACRKADRDPGEVTLIGVTKTYPAADVRILAELGVLDVGENRDQEAAPKTQQTSGLGLRWHFIGQLQSNKAASVTSYADFVHSVDRQRLVAPLSRGALRHGREVACLIQVDLGNPAIADQAPVRGGIAPDDISELAEAIAEAPGLELGGVMAVAPLGTDPAKAFTRLYEIAVAIRSTHPTATAISAGMSGDLEKAIAAGATHVRVGSSILGARPPRP